MDIAERPGEVIDGPPEDEILRGGAADGDLLDRAGPGRSGAGPEAGPAAGPVPLERLEAQLCEVAGHLAAATCRFLVLLAESDERRGWASWEASSCAAWLSWRCPMSAGTAREHVRVARALRDLPVIRAEFAAARLSYARADRAAGRPVDAQAASGFQPKRCGDPYCEFCFSLPIAATPAQIPVPV